MYILPVLILAFSGQAGHPQGLPNYPKTAKTTYEGANIVPNGDFTQGNTGFMSGLPYVTPGQDGLWGDYYTIARTFNNPQLHTLVGPGSYEAPDSRNTQKQVYFANAGGTGSMVVYSNLVHCQPYTKYDVHIDAISLSGSAWANGHEIASADWVPDFQIIVNGDKSRPQHAGCGTYDRIYWEWNSGSASTATISIVRMPIAHGGGLIGIASVTMAAEGNMPLD